MFAAVARSRRSCGVFHRQRDGCRHAFARPSPVGVARPCSPPRSRPSLAVARWPLRHPTRGAAAPSVGQLQSQLGAQQSRQQHLSSSIGSLNQLIDSSTPRSRWSSSREQAVADELAERPREAHSRPPAAGRRAGACWSSSSRPSSPPRRALLAKQLVSRLRGQPADAGLDRAQLQRLSGPAQPAQLPRPGRARAEDADQHRTTAAKQRATQAARRLARLQRPTVRSRTTPCSGSGRWSG